MAYLTNIANAERKRVRYRADVARIAVAVATMIAEHGQPNSFAPSEIHAKGGPSPLTVGRILASERGAYDVWQHLGGAERFGSCPVYRDRRLYC